MGLTDRFRGVKVALDASPIIYFFEDNPRYQPVVDPLFAALDRGEFAAVTSMVSVVEVLTQPLRHGNTELVKRYHEFFSGAVSLVTLPVSREIAERAAELRAKHGLKTPDAIHLATARHAGASFFPTNDDRSPTLPGLQAVVLEEPATQQADAKGSETSPER